MNIFSQAQSHTTATPPLPRPSLTHRVPLPSSVRCAQPLQTARSLRGRFSPQARWCGRKPAFLKQRTRGHGKLRRARASARGAMEGTTPSLSPPLPSRGRRREAGTPRLFHSTLLAAAVAAAGSAAAQVWHPFGGKFPHLYNSK